MMSLLSVTVKKAHYVGAQAASQFNSYVTLKLQNVKSTTVTVKGATPCWEQDFLFETNDLNTGLLIEVWAKGMIWDRAMGYHWLPLQGVQYSNEEGSGQWLSLDAELVMRDGEVVGTKNPTGNSLLVDCRFELPFGRCDPPTGWRSILRGSTVCRTDDAKSYASIDPENIEASDLQRKLEMLNNIMDQEARAEQARRQMQYFGHSGYSEDSDYTSDLNYPVEEHANSSASLFRSAANQLHTQQRSLETSRENSDERDDGVGHHQLPTPATHQHYLSPGSHRHRHLQQKHSPNTDDYGYGSPIVGQNTRYPDNSVDLEPMFYNSRPQNKPENSSQEWSGYNYYYGTQQQKDIDGVDMGYSDYIQPSRMAKATRRPSLERQTTLYDDPTHYTVNNEYTNQVTQVSYVTNSVRAFNQNTEKIYKPSSYPFQEERYGQDEEDRQWDSGGFFNSTKQSTGKKLPSLPVKRRPSVSVGEEGYQQSLSCAPTPTPPRRRMPQIPNRRSTSRQGSLNEESYDGFRTPELQARGASLPPTPTRTPKVLARLMAQQNKPFNSLPPTPGRQLPKPNLNHRSAKTTWRENLMKRTSSAEYTDNLEGDYYMRPGAISANQDYSEDYQYYNHLYQSNDNLPVEDLDMTPVQSDNRTSVSVENKVTTSTTITTTQAQIYTNDYTYNPPESYEKNNQKGYYNQNKYNDQNNFEEITPQNEYYNRRKLIDRPLLKQNTDSLESRDDELKDSFDTAVSSINSSLKNCNQYSGETTTTTAPTTTAAAPTPSLFNSFLDSIASTVTTAISRDQDTTKAIVTSNGATPTIQTTTAKSANTTRSNGFTRGLFKQQETIDSTYYQQQETIEETYYNQQPEIIEKPYYQQDDKNYIEEEVEEYEEEKDPYLETQESIESYIEEDVSVPEFPNNTKAITNNNNNNNRESPASVIHVENYEDDQSLRRGSSQITVVDPFHPSLQRNDPYARRPSVEPTRRTSGDNYAADNYAGDKYLDDTQYLTPPRKPSVVVDPYPGGVPPRRASVRQSPDLERQESTDIVTPTDEQEANEKKSVSFEDEEEAKPPRPQVTAQQRWHWAYNKIIMQLNVSQLNAKFH